MTAPIPQPPFELVPLTLAEVAAMLEAANITIGPGEAAFDLYVEYITGIFDATAGAMAQAEYEALLGVLQHLPPPEVLSAIRERALSNARDLITNLTTTELRKAYEQLAEAVAEGKGPREAARALKAVKGLDSGRAATYQKYVEELESSGLTDAEIERRADTLYRALLRDRRQVIAQDELRRGTSGLQAEQARARGAKFKVWQTVGDARVSDECRANEAQGPIPIDESFVSGASESPQHPRCRCSVSYFTNPALIPGLQERAATRAARTDAAVNGEV